MGLISVSRITWLLKTKHTDILQVLKPKGAHDEMGIQRVPGILLDDNNTNTLSIYIPGTVLIHLHALLT